ncbi:hypothetical protein FQR65_LT20809 [Abscondita terminalis]|nr:hypothetical protein FQR65_LT20809 [Abscondita terminalis]
MRADASEHVQASAESATCVHALLAAERGGWLTHNVRCLAFYCNAKRKESAWVPTVPPPKANTLPNSLACVPIYCLGWWTRNRANRSYCGKPHPPMCGWIHMPATARYVLNICRGILRKEHPGVLAHRYRSWTWLWLRCAAQSGLGRSGCYDYILSFRTAFCRPFYGVRYAPLPHFQLPRVPAVWDWQRWGIGPGDEVILADANWVASVAPVSGARLPSLHVPKLFIAVHLYGTFAAWMNCWHCGREYGVPVVEDAAEAIGSSTTGGVLGRWGFRCLLLPTLQDLDTAKEACSSRMDPQLFMHLGLAGQLLRAVFDTFVEDHALRDFFGTAPADMATTRRTAVKEFLSRNADFSATKDMETKLLVTVAPKWLFAPSLDAKYGDPAYQHSGPTTPPVLDGG